jgi:hypothetical protein
MIMILGTEYNDLEEICRKIPARLQRDVNTYTSQSIDIIFI